jgi:putative inorganic carbon (HCO3(-)) transporter
MAGAYIISLAFQSLIELPYFGHRIQFPELIFLLTSLVVLPEIRKFRIKLNDVDKAVLVYLLVNILALIFNEIHAQGLLEVIGRLYLGAVYLLFRLVISKIAEDKWRNLLHRSFVIMGSVAATIAITGWSLAFIGDQENLAAQMYLAYPYFGDIYRAQGFTSSPTMLILLLSVPLLLMYPGGTNLLRLEKRTLIISGLILFSALLTFSKTIFLLLAVQFIFYRREKASSRVRVISLMVVVTVYIMLTHFLYFNSPTNWNERLRDTPFTTNVILFENEHITIIESFYLHSKKCALAMTKGNWAWGIGPGDFFEEVSKLEDETITGVDKFNGFDPHSTYMGALAETGLIGLISIVILLIVIIRAINHLPYSYVYRWGMMGIVTLFIIQGITTDIMNMRVLWVVLGMISGMVETYKDHRVSEMKNIQLR